jgi:predicted lipoprotein with Yx(FWY)xxD motif
MGLGTILLTNKGFTLYHLTTDSSSMTSCTGGCAQAWPPLLLPKGVDRVAGGGLKGFSTITRRGGGRQITYRGMPLYTYAGDARPGQASGQGIGGVWFAVRA